MKHCAAFCLAFIFYLLLLYKIQKMQKSKKMTKTKDQIPKRTTVNFKNISTKKKIIELAAQNEISHSRIIERMCKFCIDNDIKFITY